MMSKMMSEFRQKIPVNRGDFRSIAAAMYMSRSRLSTRFKEETGENLSDYIMREKVEEAKQLLTYTDKSIAAISAYLAFSSQSHFTRQFKNITGRTPGEYRERSRS